MEEILELLLEGLRGVSCGVLILVHIVTMTAGLICMVEAANIWGKEPSEITCFDKRKKRSFFLVGCVSLMLLVISATLLTRLTHVDLFGLYFLYSIVLLVSTLYSFVTPE